MGIGLIITIAAIAYAIGSINFSVIISRKTAGYDIREKGSGNAGTTNMLRNLGVKSAVITLVCDILKGVISVFIALLIGKIFKAENIALLIQTAGIAVILGHTFPIFFEFRGGKGVATALGVILCINPKVRFTLFSICSSYNCINTYGISRFCRSSCIIPSMYII